MPTTSANLGFPLPDPPNDSRAAGEAAVRQFLIALDAYLVGFTSAPAGYFAPLTDGDVDDPQIIYAEGQVVLAWVDL